MKKISTVGIIGGGVMGSAISSRIGREFRVCVCEKDAKQRAYLKRKYNIPSVDLKTLMKKSLIVVLAVKPQDFDDVIEELKEYVTGKHLIISIAAGVTVNYIEKNLAGSVRVIRAMPNLPAKIGEGITAISKGKYASNRDLSVAHKIFKNVGKVLVVPEKKLDIITAVSGSGPAYYFNFGELLTDTANELGLYKEEAYFCVNTTLVGSSLLYDQSEKDFASLRKEVTSKGGTTEAALSKTNVGKFKKLMKKMLNDAIKRAGELSK